LGWSTGSNHDAYEKQTITGPSGSVRSRSSVGWDRGFTGYVADQETGLCYARARMYSPTLGRFTGRDPHRSWPTQLNDGRPMPLDGYKDGLSLCAAWFAPNALDPFGMEKVICCVCPKTNEDKYYDPDTECCQTQDSKGDPICRIRPKQVDGTKRSAAWIP